MKITTEKINQPLETEARLNDIFVSLGALSCSQELATGAYPKPD